MDKERSTKTFAWGSGPTGYQGKNQGKGKSRDWPRKGAEPDKELSPQDCSAQSEHGRIDVSHLQTSHTSLFTFRTDKTQDTMLPFPSGKWRQMREKHPDQVTHPSETLSRSSG